MQCSSWGLTRAEQGGRISSFTLLVMLLWMQLKRPFPFCVANPHGYKQASENATRVLGLQLCLTSGKSFQAMKRMQTSTKVVVVVCSGI